MELRFCLKVENYEKTSFITGNRPEGDFMKKVFNYLALSLILVTTFILSAAQAEDKPETWLGVYSQTIDEDLKEAFGLDSDSGAIIKYVVPDSPADKAGLKQGDIIIRVGDRILSGSDDLANAVRALKPGDEVDIAIIRDGNEKSIAATLGSDVEDDSKIKSKFKWFGNSGTNPQTYMFQGYDKSRSYIGVNLEELNGQLGEYFGVDDGKGVLVVEVVKDSPAEKAGVKAGDVIFRIDGNDVEQIDEIQDAINVKKPGEMVKLTLLRNKKTENFSVEVAQAPDDFDEPFMYQIPDPDNLYFFSPKMKGMFHGDWDDDQFDVDEQQKKMQEMRDEIDALKKELEEVKQKIE